MKRICTAIIVLVAMISPSAAQQAFKSLSIGVEVGTTGLGVDIAVPLITDHLVVRGGLTAPSLSYPFNIKVGMSELNQEIADANAMLGQSGIDERISTSFSDMDLTLTPVLNLSTAKLLFEIYPFRKSSFHIVAGAYMGIGDNFIAATAMTDKAFWSDYKSLQGEISAINEKYAGVPGYETIDISSAKFNVLDKSYEFREDGGRGALDAELQIAKFRPYVGLGFGRSMPKKHLGFQFEIGAWYHGKPSLVSGSQIDYDASLPDMTPDFFGDGGMESILDKWGRFYPQLSLRLIYRIF